MNRKERRRGAKARRAALAILIAGTLTTSGGAVSFTGTTLNAKTINLEQAYSTYTTTAAAITFTVDTLVSGKGYAINTSGTPDITINNGYEFDITGAANGDVLLDATAVTASGNLGLLTSKAVALKGTPGTLAAGDKLTLIKGATGSFSTLSDVDVGGYKFKVEYDDSGGTNYLYATVTAVPVTDVPETLPPPQTETPILKDNIPAVKVPTQPGKTADLPKTVDFGNGYASDVTWQSSNGKIAEIDKNGDLVGVGEGVVTLTATSVDDPSKTISITVTIAKNVAKVRSQQKTLYLKKGKAYTPSIDFDGKDASGKAWGNKGYGVAPKLTWTSSNSKIAKVDSVTGKIIPLKKGTAKITATALNGTKYTFTVKVVAGATKLKSLTLTKPPKTIKAGQTKILKVNLAPSKATNLSVTFKSSKPAVLKVDKAGKLYAVKKGTATITVKAGSKTVKVKVAVK